MNQVPFVIRAFITVLNSRGSQKNKEGGQVKVSEGLGREGFLAEMILELNFHAPAGFRKINWKGISGTEAWNSVISFRTASDSVLLEQKWSIWAIKTGLGGADRQTRATSREPCCEVSALKNVPADNNREPCKDFRTVVTGSGLCLGQTSM